MFADDTTLYASHRNTTYLKYVLQEILTNLDRWFNANSLSLNLTKTVVIKFWNELSAQKDTFQLKLDNTVLPIVNQTKFLGATIDSKLQWTEHINNVISKISLNKNLIGWVKNLFNIQAKNSIYYAHIYSHITYANVIWGNFVTTKQMKMINSIQNYCIRVKKIHQETHTWTPCIKA